MKLPPDSDQNAYELSGGEYSVYGFQYKPGVGDAVSSIHRIPYFDSTLTPHLVHFVDK